VIFVDSSFWIALTHTRDHNRQVAEELFRMHSRESLLTTNLVAGETWTFLRRRDGHRIAVGFLDDLERSPRVRVERIDEALEREAWAWLRRHDERRYSFVDATSFALMRSRQIRDALAFDGDFEAAGYRELRA
jgi:uncharacterized protein